MKIVITKITPTFPKKVGLQWDLEAVSVSGNFTFDIERSGSPAGPWTVIANAVSTYLYEDNLDQEDANVLSLGRDIYYRVKAIPPVGSSFYSTIINLDGQSQSETEDTIPGIGYKIDTPQQTEPEPTTNLMTRPNLEGRKRLLRRKILRDEYILFKKLAGIEFYLLKRRHWGVRCSDCYDPASRTVLKSNCTTCFGTSWEGGYFNPVSLYGRRKTTIIQSDMSAQSKTDMATTQIQFLDFPRIDEGDLLVESNGNRRFLVKQRFFTSLKTIPVHQTVNVSELERQAIEYRISVP